MINVIEPIRITMCVVFAISILIDFHAMYISKQKNLKKLNERNQIISSFIKEKYHGTKGMIVFLTGIFCKIMIFFWLYK